MSSYEVLADKLIDLANVDWRGRESQRNTCRYGMEMLISLIVNFGLTLIIGLLLGIFKEVLIYLLAWGSLRLFSGGRHAANHLNCISIFITVMVLVIFISKFLVVRIDIRNIEIAVFIVAFILNSLYAGNQKTDPRRKIKNKKITIMILIIQFVIVIIGSIMQFRTSINQLHLVAVITGAVLAESLFLIPFHYSKKKA